MTILPDGRWAMSSAEIEKKVWEKVKGWVLAPDGRHLVPNFPECTARKLVAICQPCGKLSGVNYHCTKQNQFISVSWCNKCAEGGGHEPTGGIAQEKTPSSNGS